MRETFVIVKARNIGVPLLEEVITWLLEGPEHEPLCDECNNDILSLAWRDVNASMRDAMKEYPLGLASKGAVPEMTTGV